LEKVKIHLYRSKCTKRYQYVARCLFYPLEMLINAVPRVYEKFFCFIIRANEVEYVLRAE